MLVTKSISRVAAGAALALIVFVNSRAADVPVKDPGAGPISTGMSACLMANQLHRGPPCPEPKPAADDASVSERLAALLARATYFADMQQFGKGLAETDAALAIDPNDVKALHLAARFSLSLGDIDRAERDIILARKRVPTDAAVNTTYAMVLLARHATTEAFKVLQSVVVSHPDFIYAREQRAAIRILWGELQSARPEYEAALADYNFIIERSPPSARLFAMRARVFLVLDRPDSAAADLSAAVKLEPASFALLAERASAYMQTGLDELAVQDLNEVLGTTGGSPVYVMMRDDRAKLLSKRARAYTHLHRFEDAARDAVAAVSLGGTAAILRMQVFLRRNGFPEAPLDGKDSSALREAISACFGLNACSQGLMQAI